MEDSDVSGAPSPPPFTAGPFQVAPPITGGRGGHSESSDSDDNDSDDNGPDDNDSDDSATQVGSELGANEGQWS